MSMKAHAHLAISRVFALAALSLVLPSACGKTTAGTGNSNTNWLKTCAADADCGGGLSCLCGTCTLACSDGAGCSVLEGAVCATPASRSAACGQGTSIPSSLCLAACGPLDACATGQSCVDGACVKSQITPIDAGSGGSSGSGGGGSGGAGGLAHDAGNGGSGGQTLEHTDSGTDSCVGKCPQGTVCVEHQTEGGGALYFPNDAGVCPPGFVIVPEWGPTACWGAPRFDCEPLPKACNGFPPDCNCVASELCGTAVLCTEASATHVRCLMQAP